MLTHELTPYLHQKLAGVTHSRLQAEAEIRLILKTVFRLTPEQVLACPERPLDPHACHLLESVLQRRVNERIPIQYLFAETGFYGLTLHVSPAVLIPRPETELLVELALNLTLNLSLKGEGTPRKILELGTGSGAVILVLAKHLTAEQAHLTATDISPAALSVARENARQLKLTDRIRFKLGDLFQPVAEEQFDLIVWNPPYIDPALKPTLAPEVLQHEPALALFADEHGLACYRRLAETAQQHLLPGGQVLVELGDGMGPAVSQLFIANGWAPPILHNDLSGTPRVLQIGSLQT